MIPTPTKELTLTRADIRTINLMLLDILNDDYDEIGKMSFQEIFDLLEGNQTFSIFEKYKENVILVSQMFDYYATRSLKSEEFNYIISNLYDLRSHYEEVYDRGFTYLLEICLELYVHYDNYKADYNGETKRRYYWNELFQDFSIVCCNMVELLRAEIRNISRICKRLRLNRTVNNP